MNALNTFKKASMALAVAMSLTGCIDGGGDATDPSLVAMEERMAAPLGVTQPSTMKRAQAMSANTSPWLPNNFLPTSNFTRRYIYEVVVGPTPARYVDTPHPIAALATSYENAKSYGITAIKFPDFVRTVSKDQPLAWTLGDFYQHGNIDVFTAKQNYVFWEDREAADQSLTNVTWPQIQADPGKYASYYQFWHRNADGTLTQEGETYRGCLHPRKAITADFNNDGTPDVFVACHGYDKQMPGVNTLEKSQLLLSNGHGFTLSELPWTSFYHGASAADVNGDGWADIVVADVSSAQNVHFLINNHDGTFTKDTSRVNITQHPYFSVELVDVNGDGNLDLIAAGQEYDARLPSVPGFTIGGDTVILYGDATGRFGYGNKTVIPAVPGRGTVLDFTVLTNYANQRIVFVGRSADGADPAYSYYSTQTLQKFNVSTNTSEVVLDRLVQGKWIAWWMPTSQNNEVGVKPYSDHNPDLFYSAN